MAEALKPEDWIKKYPEAMKALCEGKAAVMPIETVPIIHGTNEPFAPSRVEHINQTVSRHLTRRLDK